MAPTLSSSCIIILLAMWFKKVADLTMSSTGVADQLPVTKISALKKQVTDTI